MPTRIEGRSSRHDLIEDIVEAPNSTTAFVSNSASSFLMDGTKSLGNRTYSSYSNIPTLFNNKGKMEKSSALPPTGSSGLTTASTTADLRDRLHLTLPRSSSSSTMMSHDERRKELDLVLKHLYDGKLLTTMHDDRPGSDNSEPITPVLSKAPITTTSTSLKNDDDLRTNIEMLHLDEDGTSLQRELQEKELDIIHLHKEIQELQLENKLLRAKVPTSYASGNATETEVLRREKDVLQNELRIQQDLVAKLQVQQHQNGSVARVNRFDDAAFHQKEALERKIRNYEKQFRTLNGEHEKLKQICQENERTISQLKRENEELQQKKIHKRLSILLSLLDPSFSSDRFFSRSSQSSQVNEAKKRNEELLYQEFNALRNDLKLLKQRNDELFEENRHLQQEQQRQQQNLAWRSTLQQAYGNEASIPQLPSSSSNTTSHLTRLEQMPTSASPMKNLNLDAKRDRSKIGRSESPNVSEGSDSTNYLTTVSVERYNNRPASSSIHRSSTMDGSNSHQRTIRYTPLPGQDDFNRNHLSNTLSKSIDTQVNYRTPKMKRSVEWDEENLQQTEGVMQRDNGHYEIHHRPQRHNSTDGNLDYMGPTGLPPTGSASTSHLYQQNYGLSRSVSVVPESQHHSRRSNSYNMPMRQMSHDDDLSIDDRHQPRQRRTSVETTSPRRPYAPSSISDIHINDLIKFSRPGGKISKGIVKYIGSLPGKSDQYLGLELEDEESKHDGVYQGQRLFQCKPNKGVFVGFSKVIMAWSAK